MLLFENNKDKIEMEQQIFEQVVSGVYNAPLNVF